MGTPSIKYGEEAVWPGVTAHLTVMELPQRYYPEVFPEGIASIASIAISILVTNITAAPRPSCTAV